MRSAFFNLWKLIFRYLTEIWNLDHNNDSLLSLMILRFETKLTTVSSVCRLCDYLLMLKNAWWNIFSLRRRPKFFGLLQFTWWSYCDTTERQHHHAMFSCPRIRSHPPWCLYAQPFSSRNLEYLEIFITHKLSNFRMNNYWKRVFRLWNIPKFTKKWY